MTRVAVIGLGAMGLGIAQVYAAAGFHVVATDASQTARMTAKARVADTLSGRVKAGKLAADEADATLARIRVVAGLEDLQDADLAIEAIVEAQGPKSQLLADLDRLLPPPSVIATNTSSLGVALLSQSMAHPSRMLGLHFFNPAQAMRLVELVTHDATASDAVTLARRVTEAAGKTVIQCADSPGFVVNRCARPFYGEALALLEEGRSAAEIDGAMLAAGYRLGPFALIDLIGSDVNLAATETIYEANDRHPRYHPFAALKRRVLSGHLGRKSGLGFLYPDTATQTPADAGAIALRIEATLVNEAAWLAASGGPVPDDIDTAIRLGLNFPRGPFEMLAHHGLPRVRQTLRGLAQTAPAYLAGRYDLAPLLQPG